MKTAVNNDLYSRMGVYEFVALVALNGVGFYCF